MRTYMAVHVKEDAFCAIIRHQSLATQYTRTQVTVPCRKNCAKSAMITAAYAMALGAALMTAPVTVFSVLFDPSAVSKGFIRLGGALLALFGLYYYGAVIGCQRGSGIQGFYASTVIGRLLVALVCLGIYLCGEAGPGILFFGVMNGAGAVMMWRAMKADGTRLT